MRTEHMAHDPDCGDCDREWWDRWPEVLDWAAGVAREHGAPAVKGKPNVRASALYHARRYFDVFHPEHVRRIDLDLD